MNKCDGYLSELYILEQTPRSLSNTSSKHLVKYKFKALLSIALSKKTWLQCLEVEERALDIRLSFDEYRARRIPLAARLSRSLW